MLDELIVHASNPERIYVLPRHSERIHIAGDGLFAAIEWLGSSGVLTEPFDERIFDPFESRIEVRSCSERCHRGAVRTSAFADTPLDF